VAVLKEFKEFLTRGNLLEIAVGLVMAVAFGAVVSALVDGLIMPLVAAVVGEPSFDNLTFTINKSVFYYGSFITALVTFLFTAAAVFFFVVKPVNAMMKKMKKSA
jgi:large conductance mechanosensitive channel